MEHVVYALHFLIEGWKVARDLLNEMVVNVDLVIFEYNMLHQPYDGMLGFGDEALFFVALGTPVAKELQVFETDAILVVDVGEGVKLVLDHSARIECR